MDDEGRCTAIMEKERCLTREPRRQGTIVDSTTTYRRDRIDCWSGVGRSQSSSSSSPLALCDEVRRTMWVDAAMNCLHWGGGRRPTSWKDKPTFWMELTSWKYKYQTESKNGKRSKVIMVVNVVRTERNISDGFIWRLSRHAVKKVVHLVEITEHVALENNTAQTQLKVHTVTSFYD